MEVVWRGELHPRAYAVFSVVEFSRGPHLPFVNGVVSVVEFSADTTSRAYMLWCSLWSSSTTDTTRRSLRCSIMLAASMKLDNTTAAYDRGNTHCCSCVS